MPRELSCLPRTEHFRNGRFAFSAGLSRIGRFRKAEVVSVRRIFKGLNLLYGTLGNIKTGFRWVTTYLATVKDLEQ